MGKEWDNFSGKASNRDSQAIRENAPLINRQSTSPFPYGGHTGASSKQERDAFITFMTAVARECLRVLKPGGHCIMWALPRTSHWTATALENAGFEVRDVLYNLVPGDSKLHAFLAGLNDEQRNAFLQLVESQDELPPALLHIQGQGFPKSTRVDRDDRFCHCDSADSDVSTSPLPQRDFHSGIEDRPLYHAASNVHNNCYTSHEQLTVSHMSKGDPLVEEEGGVQNAHYGMSTVQGSQGGYRYGHGSYDGSPLQGKEGDQSSLPSQGYALTHSHSCEHEGDLPDEPSHSPYQAQCSALPSSQDYSRPSLSGSDTGDGTHQSTKEWGNNPTPKDSAPSSSHKSHKALQSLALNNSSVFSYCTTCGKPIAKGMGTALKPSCEMWYLCRKPLAERSIAAQVLATGTGALNIDGCRIEVPQNDPNKRENVSNHNDKTSYGGGFYAFPQNWTGEKGRYPSHLLLSHSLWCTEQQCAEQCAVAILGEQSGIQVTRDGHGRGKSPMFGLNGGERNVVRRGEVGTASRYFTQLTPDTVPWLYTAKASRAERNKGCEELPEKKRDIEHWNAACKTCGCKFVLNGKPTCGHDDVEWIASKPMSNHHPTVKPLSLCSWLVRLSCPPGGIVLDPFCGSGSTGVACIYEGMRFIGIDQSLEYCTIAEARIAHALKEVKQC